MYLHSVWSFLLHSTTHGGGLSEEEEEEKEEALGLPLQFPLYGPHQ